jgi:hypothetical protein
MSEHISSSIGGPVERTVFIEQVWRRDPVLCTEHCCNTQCSRSGVLIPDDCTGVLQERGLSFEYRFKRKDAKSDVKVSSRATKHADLYSTGL